MFLPAGGNIKEIIAFDNELGNIIIDQSAGVETNSKLTYDKNGELASKFKQLPTHYQKSFTQMSYLVLLQEVKRYIKFYGYLVYSPANL